VILRTALLLVGSAFLLWKAWEARAAARAGAGTAGAVLLWRVALVEALMGALGLTAAAVAVLALRKRTRTHTLRLSDLGSPPAAEPEGEPAPGPRPVQERDQ
jgi:hypothetical protein